MTSGMKTICQEDDKINLKKCNLPAQNGDKTRINSDVLDGMKGDDNYRIVNGLIYYKGRIIWLNIQSSSIKFCKKHTIPH